jgi:hypothetical protein
MRHSAHIMLKSRGTSLIMIIDMLMPVYRTSMTLIRKFVIFRMNLVNSPNPGLYVVQVLPRPDLYTNAYPSVGRRVELDQIFQSWLNWITT